jgi:adenylate cyclase
MSVFSFAGHSLDLVQGRLRNAAGEVMLRPKSLALLTYLLRNPGRVIAKEELIGAVWPDVIVSDDSLSQCLKDIRATLGPEAEGLIRTVPRRGLILDELRVQTTDAASPVTPAPVTPSLAVLPFETDAAGQRWFADGIAEDIMTALARSRRLTVISNSYSATSDTDTRGAERARALGVSHLLEGSVRLSGDSTRISVRLLAGTTGEVLWAERYDRRLTDIFALQDEITEAVVNQLELELLPEERPRPPKSIPATRAPMPAWPFAIATCAIGTAKRSCLKRSSPPLSVPSRSTLYSQTRTRRAALPSSAMSATPKQNRPIAPPSPSIPTPMRPTSFSP